MRSLRLFGTLSSIWLPNRPPVFTTVPTSDAFVNVAYSGRRRRGLKDRSPDRVLRERLKAKPELAKPVAKLPDPDALPKALKVAARAKEVSHPDS